MSRKSYMEQACEAVPEFKTISEKFLRKYTIAGKSESCTRNYLMQVSKMVLHFECSPLELSIDQMEEYLFHIRQNEKPSMSSFKHLVYGLRTLFSMFKNEKLYLALPPGSGSKALPVVFSQAEIKLILKTPKLLKHRALFAVAYDCGLRISEVINLKITDIDFDRKRVHVRQSKHKKDRYIPVSPTHAQRAERIPFNLEPAGLAFQREGPRKSNQPRRYPPCFSFMYPKDRYPKGSLYPYPAAQLCHAPAGDGAGHCKRKKPAGACRYRHHHDVFAYRPLEPQGRVCANGKALRLCFPVIPWGQLFASFYPPC